MSIRRFHFERTEDASGVSGCGKVAEGCVFEDTGEVIVHWFGCHGSTNFYHNIEDVIAVHGHEGKTKIVFDDPASCPQNKEEVKKDGK